MYKIYIDSSQRREKSVRVVKIVDNVEQVVGEISGDIDLVSSIKQILEENNIEISEIDEVIPNLGPGSFTGLKIGVTVANTINWANKKKKIDEMYLPDYGGDPNIQLKEF